MKLSDIRSDYFTYSTRVSEIIRNFNFAGIALLWILSQENPKMFFCTNDNITPLLFFIISMIIDVLQYTIQTIIWYTFYRHKKSELIKKEVEDVENSIIKEKEFYNIIPWFCWALKILFTLVAFIYIAVIIC